MCNKPVISTTTTTKAFHVAVDNNDKATEFKFFSAKRPHMRTFYISLVTMFVGMWIWTSVAPLQIAISNTTNVSDSHLKRASTCSVLGSMLARILGGSSSDKYGSSRPMGIALIIASIATGLTSLVNTGPQLAICRFISGIGGGTLIIAQSWIAAMFSKNIIGTAMGLVLGLGYTGNGFSLSFLGSFLLPTLTKSVGEHIAWQVCLAITGAVGIFAALFALFLADDTPQAKYYTRRENQSEDGSKAKTSSIIQASKHRGTWILAFQYAMSSGTNSALLNIGTLYFVTQAGATSEASSAITSAVGWLGVTCFIGGLLSDCANKKMGRLRGRYLVQLGHLVMEGILLIIFPFVKNLGASAFLFITASMMATWAVGSTSALVPYVDKECTGSVAGIVGFFGGAGGILMISLSEYVSYMLTCVICGSLVLLSAFLALLLQLDDEDTSNNNVITETDDQNNAQQINHTKEEDV